MLNLATMLWQTEHTALFILMMFFKPMLVFGTASAGWSALRTTSVSVEELAQSPGPQPLIPLLKIEPTALSQFLRTEHAPT